MNPIPLILALSLTSCSLRVGTTPARTIAKAPAVGKGVPGKCLEFAQDKQAQFQQAGIRSKIVVYHATPLATPRAVFDESIDRKLPDATAHAAVIYDDNGRSYMLDNMSWMPTWVSSDEPLKAAQQFSGMDVAVEPAL